ncbi:MFS transporter [Streptomyces sp. NPDC056796]|uniref:MFS transporter n=1 Tax=Streptomyces sp. NPDC056796 TaxID=3345947 RepID=UPI0036AE4CD4
MQSTFASLAPPRTSPSGRSPFVLHASILIALLAASSAPTPLYSRYQDQWLLSALDITVIFSAYAVALLVALLTAGTLSDHVGRRPVLIGALALQIASMALFATAGGLSTLIGARVLQGLATGAATSAAGAALFDLESPARPGSPALTNSIAPVAGMAAGVTGATLLVHFAPGPTTTVYVVLMALFATQAAALARTPETVSPRPGALRSLRPQPALPPAARRSLQLHGAGVIAVWALGGFYSPLGPAFTRLVSPEGPAYTDGLVFFTLTSVAALTVYLTRRTPARDSALLGSSAVILAAALSIGALLLGSPLLLFAGAALAGLGFGAVSQGALRAVVSSVPPHEKSGTLASYYVLSYLAMSLPAIGAGALAADLGLRAAALSYAGCVAVLAAVAVLLLSRPPQGARAAPSSPHRPRPTGPGTSSADGITLGTRSLITHNR